MSYVEMHEVTKVIRKKTVLDQISVSFEKGRIYGLCGRNGSGKTMLLRAVAGLIYPTEGEITIGGQILHKDISFPPSVGVIIENTSLLPQFDAYTNLKHLSKIKNVATDEEIYRTLDEVGLGGEKKKVWEYSLGMRQKLAIAQALFEQPELLLLDEPTNGLDEESVERVKNLLIRERDRGTLILLASHNKEDMEFLSDEILVMSGGKIKTAK